MTQTHGQMINHVWLLSVFLLGMLAGIVLFSSDAIRKTIHFDLNAPFHQSDRLNVSRVSVLSYSLKSSTKSVLNIFDR